MARISWKQKGGVEAANRMRMGKNTVEKHAYKVRRL
jgi:hypothetical protein